MHLSWMTYTWLIDPWPTHYMGILYGTIVLGPSKITKPGCRETFASSSQSMWYEYKLPSPLYWTISRMHTTCMYTDLLCTIVFYWQFTYVHILIPRILGKFAHAKTGCGRPPGLCRRLIGADHQIKITKHLRIIIWATFKLNSHHKCKIASILIRRIMKGLW